MCVSQTIALFHERLCPRGPSAFASVLPPGITPAGRLRLGEAILIVTLGDGIGIGQMIRRGCLRRLRPESPIHFNVDAHLIEKAL